MIKNLLTRSISTGIEEWILVEDDDSPYFEVELDDGTSCYECVTSFENIKNN